MLQIYWQICHLQTYRVGLVKKVFAYGQLRLVHHSFTASKEIIYLLYILLSMRLTLHIDYISMVFNFIILRETTCKHGGLEIPNTSANRFNCYACDFDLCRDCGNAQVQKLNKEKYKQRMLKETKGVSSENNQPGTPIQLPKRGLVGSPG